MSGVSCPCRWDQAAKKRKPEPEKKPAAAGKTVQKSMLSFFKKAN